jgi:hypothetical protein
MILNNLYTKIVMSLIAIGLSFFSQFNNTSFHDYDAKMKTLIMLEKFNYTYINSFQSFNNDCNQSGTQLIKSNTYISGANDLKIFTENNLRLNSFIWMEMPENAYCNTPFVRPTHTQLLEHEAIISRNLAIKYQLIVGDFITIESDLPNFQYQVIDIIESYYGHNLGTIEQNREGLIILGNNEEVFNTIAPSAKNLLIGFSNLGTSTSIVVQESIQTIRNSTSLKELSYIMLLIPLWIVFSIFVSFNYSFSEKFNVFFYGDIDLALAHRYKLGYRDKNIIWLFLKFEIPILFVISLFICFYYLMKNFSMLRLAILTFCWVFFSNLVIILIKKLIIVKLIR